MKSLLIPLMIVIEIMSLGVCWVIAVISPSLAKKLVLWSIKTLPDKEWYQ